MNTIEKIGVAIAALAIVGGVAYYAVNTGNIPGSSADSGDVEPIEVAYVNADTGDDETGDGSKERPFRTLPKGLNAVRDYPSMNTKVILVGGTRSPYEIADVVEIWRGGIALRGEVVSGKKPVVKGMPNEAGYEGAVLKVVQRVSDVSIGQLVLEDVAITASMINNFDVSNVVFRYNVPAAQYALGVWTPGGVDRNKTINIANNEFYIGENVQHDKYDPYFNAIRLDGVEDASLRFNKFNYSGRDSLFIGISVMDAFRVDGQKNEYMQGNQQGLYRVYYLNGVVDSTIYDSST